MKGFSKTTALRVFAMCALMAVLAVLYVTGHHDTAFATAIVLAPFPVTPELQAISIAYKNPKLIADEVMPRVPVGLKAFKYTKYPIGTFFTVPENKMSRKGEPNTVEFTGEEAESSTQDYGLDDLVPNEDVKLATEQGLPDPIGKAVEGLAALNHLAREVRVAAQVHSSASYGANNKLQLAGNDRWDVAHADSTPIVDIVTALDSCILRPNVGVVGRAAYTKLAMHPTVVKAYHGTLGDTGMVPRAFLKDLFELDDLLVGEGRVNIAKPGQAVNLVRVWGNHMALICRDKTADTQRGVTFGVTAVWGGKVTGQLAEPKMGLTGSVRVRDGESVKELILANDLGFFLEDVIS